MADAITISGLKKAFGDKKILRGLDLSVPDGQSLALIGSNGSGKSTMLRSVLRLIEPDAGKIEVLGQEVTGISRSKLRKIRSQVGFVFQKHNLVPRLCALTNVLHGAQYRLTGPLSWFQSFAPQSERERALACLKRVGLEEFATHRVDKLSGGQSQRVALARALMQSPKLILADEPVASLDPVAGDEVMKLLETLCREEGITLVFCTHHLEHALAHGDRVVGLRNGEMELDKPIEETSHEELRKFYGDAGFYADAA